MKRTAKEQALFDMGQVNINTKVFKQRKLIANQPKLTTRFGTIEDLKI